MNILLVRHGESVWNRQNKIQGREDPGLSVAGTNQAVRAARRIKSERIDLIYSSRLRRCAETAKIIAGGCDAKIKFCPELEEIILGCWQGKTVDEVKKQYPKSYNSWLKAPSKAKIPGWEGISKFTKRIERAFDFIIYEGKTTSSVCVVTHWGVIAAYFSNILDMDFDRFFKSVRIDNCGVSKIFHRDDKVVIDYINDTRHLY